MRIIADNRDYYDCIQAHGQDRSLVYFRKPEEVHLKRGTWPSHGQWPFPVIDAWWLWNYEINQYIIGFCGKIYPMLEMFDRDKGSKCFSMGEIDAFVEGNLKSAEKRWYRGAGRWWKNRGRRRRDFVKFFDDCKQQQDSHIDQFLDKRCPIFVGKYSRHGQESMITYNALLRPYDFVRIFDPYTAFQEISMFMGSMAMPEKVMPIIPDELKIHSRGFTDQSFRAPFRDAKRVPK